MAGFIDWRPQALINGVNRIIDSKMNQAGAVAVATAKALVPVRTERLRNSIGYTYIQSRKTLQLHADESYAYFVEYGTRLMVAQPYLRPGLAAASRVWGTKTELQFGAIVSPGTMPMPRANARAIARNQHINRAAHAKLGRHQPTVVFHGNTARSQHGYRPAVRSRFFG